MTPTLLLVFTCSVVTASHPNPIYDAHAFMSLKAQVPNGKLYMVTAPQHTTLPVVHAWGNETERGFAYGMLLADTILDFGFNQLDAFFREEADALMAHVSWMPAAWQARIKALLDRDAPAAFELALNILTAEQHRFIADGRADVWAEVEGMALGTCAAKPDSQHCTNGPSRLARRIRALNLLPELIQMQCSMMGAWGDATGGNLVQLRSLDFGTGPFANHNLLYVSHPEDGKSFASLTFPSFVGAVTGFSETIGLSQKVDDVTGGMRPHGTYAGQAAAMVIRDVLQYAQDTDDAMDIIRSAKRTWSIWLGFGDIHHKFRAALYTKASVDERDDQTLPGLTSQPIIKDVAYIDKHPQPSSHTAFPQLIKQHYSRLNASTVVSSFFANMTTGDVHTAVYDFSAGKTYISTGTTNTNGTIFTRLACNAPFITFENKMLWDEARP